MGNKGVILQTIEWIVFVAAALAVCAEVRTKFGLTRTLALVRTQKPILSGSCRRRTLLDRP